MKTKMKLYFIILIILWLQSVGFSQLSNKTIDTISLKPYKPEIFTSGFIDIINNGQVNAAARFIRLYIGEPGKFAIPLSLYGGVSNNNFQNQSNTGGLQRSNDHLVNQYINPLSGLINISIDGVVYFKSTEKITKTGLLYHIGERVLTGYKKPGWSPIHKRANLSIF